jgi:hypothetical protein
MRSRPRSGWIAALLLIAAAPLVAQEPAEPEPRPFARTRLEPGERVTVGQPVSVVVEVLVPNWFTAAPRFPTLNVDDAIAVFEDRGINFTEELDGLTWAGQSRSYDVYPQRPGSFVIAAIPVRVRYMSDSTGPRTEVTVSPPAVSFTATLPAGAENLPYFISTTALEIEQTFDRESGTLKVGEAFVRTVTITVDGALSMVIPPLPHESVSGLAMYADPPEVRDEGGERGEQIVGTRVERITCVAEEAGEYRLAPIELVWWDVGSEELRTTVLPALEIQVEPNPELVAEIPLPPEEDVEGAAAPEPKRRVSLVELLRVWGVPLGAAVLILLLAIGLWRRYRPGLSRRVAEARRRRSESEARYFSRFRRAALSGDPKATWNHWSAWLDRAHRGPGAATIHAFVHAAGDPDLEREAAALDATLFVEAESPPRGWSGRVLYRKVARARRQSRARAGTTRDLPTSLNPGHGR